MSRPRTPAEIADEQYRGFLDTGRRPPAKRQPRHDAGRAEAFRVADKGGESLAFVGGRWLRVVIATHRAVPHV